MEVRDMKTRWLILGLCLCVALCAGCKKLTNDDIIGDYEGECTNQDGTHDCSMSLDIAKNWYHTNREKTTENANFLVGEFKIDGYFSAPIDARPGYTDIQINGQDDTLEGAHLSFKLKDGTVTSNFVLQDNGGEWEVTLTKLEE